MFENSHTTNDHMHISCGHTLQLHMKKKNNYFFFWQMRYSQWLRIFSFQWKNMNAYFSNVISIPNNFVTKQLQSLEWLSESYRELNTACKTVNSLLFRLLFSSLGDWFVYAWNCQRQMIHLIRFWKVISDHIQHSADMSTPCFKLKTNHSCNVSALLLYLTSPSALWRGRRRGKINLTPCLLYTSLVTQ